MANRLLHSTSPYLLQHANNPVDWNPWDGEALARAKAEDKPILLSIGYSACHWCHVMERESFEDEEIARLMNAHFVAVKVDREERPDLDDIYMAATLAMNQGQGGWPMTVFLTPDQEPFFAGTYFPPTDRFGRPGFRTVLERIASLWATDREGLAAQAQDLARFLRENVKAAPGLSLGEEELQGALRQLERDFDARWGGFGSAPKFPPSTALSLLLRGHRRFGNARALEMVDVTLERMARGGMYDQVGGGFHRYSVDERWRVPHFEKMLYDQALLARVYLEGWQATGSPLHQRIATEVLDYVLREMTSPEGGFYSATDADSEGEEGRFFVWTPAEVRAAVGDDELARRFCAYYDVTERGNFEGKSVPNVPEPLADVAAVLGVAPTDLEDSLDTARPLVYAARRLRVPPGLDDKVLTAWNGLMLSALAEGHRVLGDERYAAAARRAANFLLATLATAEGRLLRTYRAGTAHLAGYLEDYAFLSQGLLDLYEATGAEVYLRDSERLARRMVQDFAAEEGGFYATARDHERLLVRPREGHDGATPAANGVAAHVLARLSFHLGDAGLREEAVRAIRAWGRALARQPRAFASTLAAVDLLLEGPVEVAIVGRPGSEDRLSLVGAVGRAYLPNRIVALGDPEAAPSALPLLAGKGLVDGRAALYVCRDFACRKPVTEAADVPAALAAPLTPEEAPRRALAVPRQAGRATPEATAALASRSAFAATGYGPLGSTGLVCSRIGFGSYRVDDDTEAHRAALRRALSSGVNLVDTSTNYTDGGSERLVGAVLEELAGAGTLARESVIVVSKIGYVQGANLELAQRREAGGRPFPEVVKYGEGIWHCVHPEFLEDQLARSLERLRLDTLDVCLLHNPEYFLSDAHERSHGTLERRREEFYGRMREAFAWLEGQAAAGRIGWYGVSSNTCTRAASDPEATSLTRLLEAARAAGGEGHRFRVLQLPLNLLEPGAVLERNNGPSLERTVLEEAARAGVGVLVNRPLNAMVDESLVRLAAPGPAAADAVGLEDALAALAAREAEYRDTIAVHLEAAPGGVPPAEFFRWSMELLAMAPQVQSLEHWESLEQQRVLPQLLRALQVLDQALGGELAERWHAWRGRYVSAAQEALSAMRARAAERSREQAARLAGALDPRLPAERRGETLSRKALWVAAGAPAVSAVLVGMRQEAYVADALGVLAWPPLADVRPVFEALRGTPLAAPEVSP